MDKILLLKYGSMALIMIAFVVVIVLVSRTFSAQCESGEIYDKGRKKCRTPCDYDKDSTHVGGDYTHWDDVKSLCVTCASGQVWNGEQCHSACVHGAYNSDNQSCVCTVGDPGDKHPPVRPGEYGGQALPLSPGVTGWTGKRCEQDKDTCDLSKLTKDGKVCSGHGVASNTVDYKDCNCVCDAGWKGDLCDTAVDCMVNPDTDTIKGWCPDKEDHCASTICCPPKNTPDLLANFLADDQCALLDNKKCAPSPYNCSTLTKDQCKNAGPCHSPKSTSCKEQKIKCSTLIGPCAASHNRVPTCVKGYCICTDKPTVD